MSSHHPDGGGATIVVKLPPWFHFFVVVLLVCLFVIWNSFGPNELKSILGILAACLATYSAFYARRAIMAAGEREAFARERQRKFETIKFSRIYSDGPLATARTALSTRFRQILNSQTKGTDKEKHSKAISLLSAEMIDAMKRREDERSGQNPLKKPGDDDLIDEATAILDFFEDLAVGIEEEVFDDTTARKLLRSPTLSFWELLQGVVKQFRDQTGKPGCYIKTEELQKKWMSLPQI